MAKKKSRGNGTGTVAPRRNKQGKIIGYRGAFFGPDGKRRWVSDKNKTDCWTKLNAAMTDANRGILPPSATLTLETYLSAWLTDQVEGTVSRATHDAYKRDVHHHIIPVLGRRKLKDLSRNDVRRLYRIKRDEGLSNRSLEYIHTTLHRALKDARSEGKIYDNPTDGVRPHKTPHGAARESKALSPVQVAALLEAASKEPRSRYEALYTIAIHTGLRRGEVLGLKWSDVDFETGTLLVKRSLDVDGTLKTPKNAASRRTLKLTQRALEALKKHRVRQSEERLKAGSRWRDNNLVFPNTIGKPMNAGNFYRREFQPLLEQAGLAGEGFTFHSLRHTFATALASQNVNPATAQKMLGHSDIRMTLAIYTHATDEMQDAATAALESTFG